MQDIREKLIDLLAGYSLDTYEDVQYVADELIANDVVPVVRCKDCKWRAQMLPNDFGTEWCGVIGLYPKGDDDFCSYGEQKDGEG